MTTTRKFNEEDIQSVKVRNYNREDRNTEDNMEVSIHFKEDADVDISNNVLMFKANWFNAEELRQFVAEEE